MKKAFAVLLCFLIMTSCILPCSAADNDEVIYYSEEILEGGIIVVDTISARNQELRNVSKAYIREKAYYENGTLIAKIAVTATFRYDGQTVSVISKSITKCDTYNGWSFKQSSFTSSGGTVTLTGKLTKLLVLNANVNISLTCDENGNIS